MWSNSWSAARLPISDCGASCPTSTPANLVEKEHKIDLIRWNEAVELATFDYFDINSILSYLARVNIVARWTQLDAVRGREMFERLMAELDGKGLIENKQ